MTTHHIPAFAAPAPGDLTSVEVDGVLTVEVPE